MAVGAAAIAVGVIVAGAVTGGAVAALTGSDPSTARTDGPGLAWTCPDGDPIVALTGGARVFVTARHDTAPDWYRTRNPASPGEVWWVQGESLDRDSDGDLPAAGCGGADPGEGDAADPVDELASGETTTTVGDESSDLTTQPGLVDPFDLVDPSRTDDSSDPPGTPPPASTTRPPPPQSTTTRPPDTGGPSLSVSLSETALWEADGGGISCGSRPRSATLRATTSDPSGVANVSATWTASKQNFAVTLAGSGIRTATVGPHPYRTLASQAEQQVTVRVTASDAVGNTTVRTVAFRLHSTDQCFG